MRIERRFTTEGQDAYAGIEFRTTKSEIRNPDGSVVFKLDGIEVPASWSQVAADILAQKYFRKAGVPARLKKVEENAVPSFLWRSVPDEAALAGLPEKERTVSEHDSRQVFDRLAGTWTYWGWKGGYFDTEADASAFFDELRNMLATQKAAPNSPQWFNTGLHWAYGIDGPSQGHYYVDHKTGEVRASETAYEHPQPHACFIQSVADDLVNEGGIMDLWVREARLFKYGSGTGTNFSRLRGEGERLSGGGKSSGLMSFLKIGDRAAGAIKSGGTTRRAAKMVVVDVDHPDIEDYVNWKVKEEQKVAALVTGSKIVAQHLKAIMKASVNCAGPDDSCFDPAKNPALKREVRAAKKAQVPENYIRRVIQFARQGYKDIAFPVFDTDWDSEAYLTVSGQNSNNSVRVTDAFLEAVEKDADWKLTGRISGKVTKTLKARELFEQIGYAAWASADPGIQFHTTINEWHTCPASGEINASNPCSEYMFLDDTACNLASLNLMQFRDAEKRFDVDAYEHAVRLWTIVLEISVLMAQFPSRKIAELSYEYRTLGLGYANIGGLLMSSGIAYDSKEGRALCAALTALMTGVAYATSAEMAGELGPFPGYAKNRDAMLRVMRNHRRAAFGHGSGYDGLRIDPVPLDAAASPDQRLVERAKSAWNRAVALGEINGYRNAQATVIAPTGTIGLIMDCDTTGIEPDFALVKFKKLAGGGYFKIINRAVPEALATLGYGEAEIRGIVDYAVGRGTLKGAPGVNHDTLRAKGFTDEKLAELEAGLASAFDIKFAFNKWTLGEDFLKSLGLSEAELADPGLDLLSRLNFSKKDIEQANLFCCGAHDAGRRAGPQARAPPRLRLRQPLRQDRQALPLGREPHPHDGGGAALHLGRDLQDHQHAERRHRRGLQERLHALLAAGAEGERPLPRRLEAVAAAQRPAPRRRGGGRRRGRRAGDRPAGGGAGARHRRADRGAHRRARGARARETPQPPQGLHPEGDRRRPQGLSPHRRVRRRPSRRDLHRHAQGRRRLPLADEQLRHRHLARPAIRRAARGVCRRLHLHPLRAGGLRPGQRLHQERDLDPRLCLPRARDLLSCPPRSRPRQPGRHRRHHHRLGRVPVEGAAAGSRGLARPRPRQDQEARPRRRRRRLRHVDGRFRRLGDGDRRRPDGDARRGGSRPRPAAAGGEARGGPAGRPHRPGRAGPGGKGGSRPRLQARRHPGQGRRGDRPHERSRQDRRGAPPRLPGRCVRGMREFHARAERHVFEVRHVRQHDGVFVNAMGLAQEFSDYTPGWLNGLSDEEKQRVAEGEFGRWMHDSGASHVAWILWRRQHGILRIPPVVRNGSAFVLDCGQGPFVVTAAHVYRGYLEQLKSGGVTTQIGNVEFNLRERLIGIGAEGGPDIATFRIDPSEVASLGKTVVRGDAGGWLPPPRPGQASSWEDSLPTNVVR